MKWSRPFFAVSLIFVASTALSGLEVRYCDIKDPIKHQTNQKIFKTIIDEELASQTDRRPAKIADYLCTRITNIAQKLLESGFQPDAYDLPKLDNTAVVAFDRHVLWEGEGNAIPLTFFVYAWPPEEYALQYNVNHPENSRYKTSIHSHSIPCALAVLQGTFVQNSFERVSANPKDRSVRLLEKKNLQVGDGEVDILTKPFIHQLYGKGLSSSPCLSLHAYGLPTEEKVMECFKNTYLESTYHIK